MSSFTTVPRAPRRAALAALLLGALAMNACANDPATPQTAEETVAQRAQQRWDALLDGDFEKAWEFTQPGYRALVKSRDYYKVFGSDAKWTGASVHSATCEPARCTVKMHVSVKVTHPKFMGQEASTYFDEPWVREDGQWWYRQPL